MTKREVSVQDVDAYGWERLYSGLFLYWIAPAQAPPVPAELLTIQPDVTWQELFYSFAGNQFTQYILRRIWDRLEAKQ